MSTFKKFFNDESGATAIEYGLIAAGIAVVIITGQWHGRHQAQTASSDGFQRQADRRSHFSRSLIEAAASRFMPAGAASAILFHGDR